MRLKRQWLDMMQRLWRIEKIVGIILLFRC